MSVGKGIVTGTLLAGGLVGIAAFLWKLRRIQINLEAIPTASIYKVSLSGVTIRVDVLLKNPTKGSFSIKFPFIKLKYKGQVIGSSQVTNKDIVIPAYGEVMIDRIMIDIPLTSAFSVISSLIKSIQSKDKISMTVTILSIAMSGGLSMPFNKDFELTLA